MHHPSQDNTYHCLCYTSHSSNSEAVVGWFGEESACNIGQTFTYSEDIVTPEPREMVIQMIHMTPNLHLQRLQHNNTSPHTARLIMAYQNQQHINVSPWPSLSPHLAAIKHVWDNHTLQQLETNLVCVWHERLLCCHTGSNDGHLQCGHCIPHY